MKEIQDLKTKAPSSLAARVLLESGLADGYVSHPGPAGEMLVAFNERGVSAVHLAGDRVDFEDWFGAVHHRPAFPVTELPKRLEARLERALRTGRLGTLPIDWESMSEFQQAVLRKTAEILPGQVRPYSWVAREIGRPKAVRAVGTALARNPVPVIIPCHRVVRNDGHLGNYYYGTDVKRGILAQEGMDVGGAEARANRGIRLVGSDTTRIFCHPTCGHARRSSDEHTVEFRSETAARRAGYRPCKVCRPAVA